MTHAIVPSECVGAAECFFNRAKIALDFVLALVMNRVLVARQVVRAGEDGIAHLAGAGVDAIAAVRASLAVQNGRCHDAVLSAKVLRLAVSLAFVLLKLYR